jgi:hypothetical protein
VGEAPRINRDSQRDKNEQVSKNKKQMGGVEVE